MFKKFMTVQAILIALFAFAQAAQADPGRMGGGEGYGMMHSEYCDRADHRDCYMRHSEECDMADHRECRMMGEGRHSYGDHMRGKEGGFDILKMADEIGLYEEQVKKIKAIKYAYKKAQIRSHAEIKILKIELKELKYDYSTDVDTYARKVKELEARKGNEKIARFKMKKEISDVLTSKQRDKIKEYYKNKRKGKK